MVNGFFSLIAWAVCIALFLLQGLFGIVITFSLLGHLAQLIPGVDKSASGEGK